MNARMAIQENEMKVQQLIEAAIDLQKIKNITLIEALDLKTEINLKYATNDTERAAIDIRNDDAKMYVKYKM